MSKKYDLQWLKETIDEFTSKYPNWEDMTYEIYEESTINLVELILDISHDENGNHRTKYVIGRFSK